MTTSATLDASFRDPSGFLFRSEDGTLYRQVNSCYKDDFDLLESSGLYEELTAAGLLIPHELAPLDLARTDDAVAVIKPELVPFISYPYEWCMGQLQDAALLTLEIQRRALKRGMSLKDASAYNVQFRGTKPVFIDTLSFGKLPEGSPWVAYKQFCQHFLAPLALMAYVNPDLVGLLRGHVDGVPLPMAAKMLPWKTKVWGGLMLHLHMHARMIDRYGSKPGDAASTANQGSMTVKRLDAIAISLGETIKNFRPAKARSVWFGYEEDAPYGESAEDAKKELVREYLARIRPDSVWDLGANTGAYSLLARQTDALTIAMEQDHACVNSAYRKWKAGEIDILPMRVDLTNPSPALGWAHGERDSLAQRGPAGVVMALALIHHICISNNVPLDRFAAYLAELGDHAIVEFVDKPDPMVQHLLASREDVFPNYTPEGFRAAFEEHFEFLDSRPCGESHRTLHLLKRGGA